MRRSSSKRKKDMQGGAFLVAVQHAKASAVAEQTDGPVGRAPQDIWIFHEGRRGPAVADRANSE